MGERHLNLLIFGYGYTSQALVRHEGKRFATITATVRSPEKAAALAQGGLTMRVFNDLAVDRGLAQDVAAADAVLVSIRPMERANQCCGALKRARLRPELRWIGYLSTVGVYGDHGGDWVDETTSPRPLSERSGAASRPRQAWLDFGRRVGKAVQVFRLAGIYGPGQNALVNLARGHGAAAIKPGQVFNRIHVDDIAGALPLRWSGRAWGHLRRPLTTSRRRRRTW